MARVAVLHNTLDFHGGADAVCLVVCEALSRDHDVTLFTVSETAPADLADRFDVRVDDVRVRTPPAGTAVARALSGAAPWLGPQLAFRSVLLHRFFRSRADRFDLAVSTANEFSLPVPSVQYVHYPQFNRHRRRGAVSGSESESEPSSEPRSEREPGTESRSEPGTGPRSNSGPVSEPEADPGRLNRLWSRLAGPTPEALAGDGVTLLANSSWTADVVARVYGTRPAVLYPPVDPIRCDRPWTDREDGIVVAGRLAPDKRPLDAIGVVDGVRDRGHDVHLHLVGAAPRAYRRYADRVAAAAADRRYVTLDRDVPRERLEEMLCAHKYGLNAKPGEHFGMAVAEYVAAGMVAFAPASGGQRDVLDGRPDRLFRSIPEAVDLVSRAVAADEPPTLPADRFGRDRFRAALRGHVAEAIGRNI